MRKKPEPLKETEKQNPRASFHPADVLFGAYGFALFVALVIRHVLADRTIWSFALNSLFQHAFWPVLILLPLAIVRRTKVDGVVIGASILIFAGDLNATAQNTAYAIVTRSMHDAWREAGWGMGHTFPGKPTPDVGGSRPVIFGIPVPQWLVRIDYIFHSNSLTTIDAQLGPGDAGSDHRPVVVTLAL